MLPIETVTPSLVAYAVGGLWANLIVLSGLLELAELHCCVAVPGVTTWSCDRLCRDKILGFWRDIIVG
jgi:hypothetical protein